MWVGGTIFLLCPILKADKQYMLIWQEIGNVHAMVLGKNFTWLKSIFINGRILFWQN